MISRFAKVLATGLPHTINVTGSLPTITITAKEFRLAESRLIFGREKRRGRLRKEYCYNRVTVTTHRLYCSYQVCPRPGLGNDTSLPACEEYVEDNPRLQVSCRIAQMFETFLWLFSFESSQAVVSLMSGGGVGVGDRLDTLDTDLVKKVW